MAFFQQLKQMKLPLPVFPWYIIDNSLSKFFKEVPLMRVKCVICDKIETIDDESLMAKRLRNRPIHTYMCKDCHERISEKTNARLETGNFRFYRSRPDKDDWWIEMRKRAGARQFSKLGKINSYYAKTPSSHCRSLRFFIPQSGSSHISQVHD